MTFEQTLSNKPSNISMLQEPRQTMLPTCSELICGNVTNIASRSFFSQKHRV